MNKVFGFSFVEILISLFLLSLIFLGLEGAGFYALQQERETWLMRIAINQLSNITERVYAISDETEIEKEIRLWNQENKKLLPKGRGSLSDERMITLCWKEKTCLSTLIYKKD